MQGREFWTVAFPVSLIVGFSKGGWSADGNLGVPILSLVISPLAAAGLMLPGYLVTDAVGLWAFRKSFGHCILSIRIPAGLVGVGLGWAVIPVVGTNIPGSETIVTGEEGAIGIVFSAYMSFHLDPATVARETKAVIGAVSIFECLSGGDVGFTGGHDDTHFFVLSRNQSDAVTIARIAKSRLLGARWPATY